MDTAQVTKGWFFQTCLEPDPLKKHDLTSPPPSQLPAAFHPRNSCQLRRKRPDENPYERGALRQLNHPKMKNRNQTPSEVAQTVGRSEG